MTVESPNRARRRVVPMDAAVLSLARQRLDNLTKPRGSLGVLEELAARYMAVRGDARALMGKRRVCVFVGDHGVTAEGVSAFPPAVTGLMVTNFLKGGAAINVLARRADADVEVVDVGMAEDPDRPPGLILANVRRGTANLARGPAMSKSEAQAAIAVGVTRAATAAAEGVTVLATGEMGIGNSTPAAALMARYLGLAASELAGPGTGLDRDGVRHKADVIARALARHPGIEDPLDVLADLGGLEIAAICGLCLGGAANRQMVVVDGFISSAGALAAMRLCPAVKDYLVFAHMSAEPGHRRFFEAEKLRPLMSLDLRLGEGTGAALAMQVLTNAVAIYHEMATFAEAGIGA